VSSNLSGFANWSEDLVADVEDFVASSHRGVHRKVLYVAQLLTPVKTGQLVGSWVSSVGSPATFKPNDPHPREGPVKTASVLAGMRPGDSTWIVNNQDYARKIEEGGVHGPGRFMGKIAAESMGEGF